LYFCRVLSGEGRAVISLPVREGHKRIELPVLVHRIRELEDPLLQPVLVLFGAECMYSDQAV